MAIPKVCGIETEYGILARGADLSAVAASTVLVNAYSGRKATNAWDFSAERPHVDARSGSLDTSSFPEIEYQLANTVLVNGSRYYVDHAHPEVSSPECRDALEVVRYDLAADEIVRESMRRAGEILGPDVEIVTYKNNSDGKGNSYGCHENYLVDRAVPFGKLAALIATHFVSRQVFCGSGKIGFENHGIARSSGYQISQRADFFEEDVGLETTVRRPVVNSRDEPHANAERYRRLHVIVGDANISQVATLLKVGTTAIVLAMIEDGCFPENLQTQSPVHAIRQFSGDTSLTQTVAMIDGRLMSALDIQETLLDAAQEWGDRFGFEAVGMTCGPEVLLEWERVLADLRADPARTRDRVDWVAKQLILDSYAESRGLAPHDARLRLIDIQYHDLRTDRSIAAKANLRSIFDITSVRTAINEPPESTRAYFRGKVLAKWPDAVVAANWDSMVLDVGADALVRIPMEEPLRGTRELVESVLQAADSPRELVERLGETHPDMRS